MQNTAVKCPACGLQMVESKGVFLCPDWDGIQPQELEIDPKTKTSYPRKPSTWDVLHVKYDRERMKEWYAA